MTVPKVLIVYYSQTGQLSALAQYFAKPLQQAGVVTDCVPLVPQQPYPFPWRFWRFFDTFPETAHLRPAPIEPPQIPHDDYDAVVIAYTVWFLAPSQPITAFLQRPETRRLLAGKPVITLIGCRNMWLAAQEKMKTLLAANGAQLVGNIVKTDACGTAASFVTTPAWLLTGNKRCSRATNAISAACPPQASPKTSWQTARVSAKNCAMPCWQARRSTKRCFKTWARRGWTKS